MPVFSSSRNVNISLSLIRMDPRWAGGLSCFRFHSQCSWCMFIFRVLSVAHHGVFLIAERKLCAANTTSWDELGITGACYRLVGHHSLSRSPSLSISLSRSPAFNFNISLSLSSSRSPGLSLSSRCSHRFRCCPRCHVFC